jgi:hypothetical protein
LIKRLFIESWLLYKPKLERRFVLFTFRVKWEQPKQSPFFFTETLLPIVMKCRIF